MTLITTLEIDEVSTEVAIDFKSYFGEPEVQLITDLSTGDAICPELSDEVYNEMAEMYADLKADNYFN